MSIHLGMIAIYYSLFVFLLYLDGMTFWRLYHYDIREFHVFSEEPSKTKGMHLVTKIIQLTIMLMCM